MAATKENGERWTVEVTAPGRSDRIDMDWSSEAGPVLA
jgi:hypothetical protein